MTEGNPFRGPHRKLEVHSPQSEIEDFCQHLREGAKGTSIM